MKVEFGKRRLRKVFEDHVELARLRIRVRGPEQLDVRREAVGGENQAVAFAGSRFPEIDRARDRPREGRAERVSVVPTFEVSGHRASSVVPISASASEQVVLPSAAFGLIENPAGRLTLAARI